MGEQAYEFSVKGCSIPARHVNPGYAHTGGHLPSLNALVAARQVMKWIRVARCFTGSGRRGAAESRPGPGIPAYFRTMA